MLVFQISYSYTPVVGSPENYDTVTPLGILRSDRCESTMAGNTVNTEKNAYFANEKHELMYSGARKMHLIEDLIKVNNEAVLIEIESVLKKAANGGQNNRPSAHDLVGVWSKEDAEAIEKAIEEGCEQIHPDDWK